MPHVQSFESMRRCASPRQVQRKCSPRGLRRAARSATLCAREHRASPPAIRGPFRQPGLVGPRSRVPLRLASLVRPPTRGGHGAARCMRLRLRRTRLRQSRARRTRASGSCIGHPLFNGDGGRYGCGRSDQKQIAPTDRQREQADRHRDRVGSHHEHGDTGDGDCCREPTPPPQGERAEQTEDEHRRPHSHTLMPAVSGDRQGRDQRDQHEPDVAGARSKRCHITRNRLTTDTKTKANDGDEHDHPVRKSTRTRSQHRPSSSRFRPTARAIAVCARLHSCGHDQRRARHQALRQVDRRRRRLVRLRARHRHRLPRAQRRREVDDAANDHRPDTVHLGQTSIARSSTSILPNPGHIVGVMLDASAPARRSDRTRDATARGSAPRAPTTMPLGHARAGRPAGRCRQATGRQLLVRYASTARNRNRVDRAIQGS